MMYKSEYAKMFSSEERLWWYQALRELIGYYILTYGTGRCKVLDAGCGTGKNMEYLQGEGYHVEGFDYSTEAVEFCRRRGLEQVSQGSVTDIKYAEESFDIVICLDVLGSLDKEQRERAVAELMRVLKTGGLILINSASLKAFSSQHDAVGNIKIRFNKEEFMSLFKRYDLEIIKFSYRVFLLSPLVGFFKFVKKVGQLLRPNSTPKSDQIIFPFGINRALLHVQLLDNILLKTVDLPFGSSLFFVARKK